MKTIEITIGHNVGDAPKWSTEDVIEAATRVLNVNACTAIPCKGVWCGQLEDSTRLEIANLTDEVAQTIINRIPTLCEELEQEAIMLSTRELHTAFIEPNIAMNELEVLNYETF